MPLPDSIAIQIADAVVAELNAAASGETPTLPGGFTAVRDYGPVYKIEDLSDREATGQTPARKGLHVTVIPLTIDIERADRAATQGDYEVDVTIQKCVQSRDEKDELIVIAEKVGRYFAPSDSHGGAVVALAGGDRAKWVHSGHPYLFDPDLLRTDGEMITVVALTWRVLK